MVNTYHQGRKEHYLQCIILESILKQLKSRNTTLYKELKQLFPMAIVALIRSLLFPFAIYTTTHTQTSNITSMIEIFGHVSKYLRILHFVKYLLYGKFISYG